VAIPQPPGGHHKPPVHEVDWEVLPPEEERKRREIGPIFKWIALIMDEVIRVPGTKFRFGLDPLLGLIPGIGDASSAVVSGFALLQAVRLGVPKILLARMAVNILVNEVIGVVPVIGDAFSFWFKSNARNYEIIKQHVATPGAVTRRSDWIFVIGVLVLLVVIVCVGVLFSLFVLGAIASLLTGRRF
jgi:hypothetical protein